MKHSLPPLLLMLGILALAPAGLLAQPVAANSTATWYATDPDCSTILVPDGTGTPLTACWAHGGTVCDAAIVVELLDASLNPVVGWPNTSVRLTRTPPSPLSWCADSFYPPPIHAPNCSEYDSDSVGHTKFTLAYHGGGCQEQWARVWVEEAPGVWAMIPSVVPLKLNSPDINGDLVVDLLDFVQFVTLYFGPYSYCIDYNYDDVNDLMDVVLFARYGMPGGGFGPTCP